MKYKELLLIVFLYFYPLVGNASFFNSDTLIHKGSSWKYLDSGVYPGSDWTLLSFNDSSWSLGNAELGYGENDENTVVNFGPDPSNRYITTYFRNTFTLLNDSTCRGIRIELKRDDGAVVYLNGQEVYRSNMPSWTIADTTLAISTTSDDEEVNFILIALGNTHIVNGINQIAVEVHQNVASSDDLSFDLSLIADTDAEIIRGPYLQMATPNSMVVRWRTSVPEISKINFGISQVYTDSLVDTNLVIDHALDLSGLQSNTKYFYAVCSANRILREGPEQFFITPPVTGSSQPVRIWAFGDAGSGKIEQNLVRDAYYNYTGSDYTNLIISLGDNAYTSGTDEEYSNNFFRDHYEEILAKSVLYSACGNHDYYTAWGSNQTGTYYDIFTFPKNGEAGGVASGNEAYYSFNYSNIHFICLESNIDSFGIINLNQMISWLYSDLSANTLPWTIVYFHSPPFSMGYHNSDISDEGAYMRENIVPILETFNVDLVLSGHSHDYERTFLLKGHFGVSSTFSSAFVVDSGSGALPNFYDKRTTADSGTVYCVAGCGGGDLGQASSGWPHPAMYFSSDTSYGSMAITINGDTLDGKFLDLNGTVLDNFTIVKDVLTRVIELDTNFASMNLFPNPANTILNINYWQNTPGKIEVRMINAYGEVIKLYSDFGNTFSTQSDIKMLPAGIYIITVDSQIYKTKKIFVKE